MEKIKGGKNVKKVLIFLSLIVFIFVLIWFLNQYQQKEKAKDNPYNKSTLHNETIAQLDDPNYQNIILPDELNKKLENGEEAIVYFYSPTCHYCKQTTPVVVPLSKDLGIDLKLFNLLEFQEGWDEYKIEGTPTIIYFNNGQEIARIEGFQEKEVFEQWFKDHVLK